MIKTFFSNIFRRKLFNKLFLLYSVIIVLAFVILQFFVSSKVTGIITEQDITFDRQVLETVDVFFAGKCKQVKTALISLYQDTYARAGAGKTGKDAMSVLRNMKAGDVDTDIEYSQSMYRFIDDYCLSRDEDLSSVSVLSRATHKVYTSWRRVRIPDGNVLAVDGSDGSAASARPKLYYKPAADIGNYGKVLLIYDVIRDSGDLSKKLGYLVFSYGADVVKNSYESYAPYLKGTIVILSPQGGVLFDSGGDYYGNQYPDFDRIEALGGGGTLRGEDFIVNVLRNNEYGFYTLGIIPMKAVNAEVGSANRIILLLIAVSIATILALSYVSTRLFSVRVKTLIAGIQKIRRGDLTARTHVSGEDELTEISANLNEMCDKLDEHIKKEYVYKLRQREAELYTLQAQVNPHFLYNSLEAIRMCALKDGNADVGRMVLLLAEIFRGSIKEKIVVSIKNELNNCKSFLEFYNIRYEGKLDLVYNIDDEILRYGILQHLIQPIIENVLVHGINLFREDNVVMIEGRKEGGDIVIVVRDNGNGMPPERLEQIRVGLEAAHRDEMGSIGIVNVNQRIRLIYGEEYGVSVQSAANEGTEVTIRIKARTMEELTLDVQGAAG